MGEKERISSEMMNYLFRRAENNLYAPQFEQAVECFQVAPAQ